MFKESILLISLISIFLLSLSCAPVNQSKGLKPPSLNNLARECLTHHGNICPLTFRVPIGEYCVCNEFLVIFGEGFFQDFEGIAR